MIPKFSLPISFSWTRLWVECILIRPCLIAIVALTCGNYVIYPFFLECPMPDDAIRLIAAIGKSLGDIWFITIVQMCNSQIQGQIPLLRGPRPVKADFFYIIIVKCEKQFFFVFFPVFFLSVCNSLSLWFYYFSFFKYYDTNKNYKSLKGLMGARPQLIA